MTADAIFHAEKRRGQESKAKKSGIRKKKGEESTDWGALWNVSTPDWGETQVTAKKMKPGE